VLVLALCFWAGATVGLAVGAHPVLALVAWWLAKAALLGVVYVCTGGPEAQVGVCAGDRGRRVPLPAPPIRMEGAVGRTVGEADEAATAPLHAAG
jgi:hypothetical protein